MTNRSDKQRDQDEQKLLFELMRHAKENIGVIAKNCGFSRQKTARMIKRLEANKLVWGYTTIFDEQKIGLNHFVLLMKKTNKRYSEQTMNQIISRSGFDILENLDDYIETSAYVHGEYDWMSTFLAKDLHEAKKYVAALWGHYSEEIGKITLLQTLMCVKKQFILNPEREKLKDIM